MKNTNKQQRKRNQNRPQGRRGKKNLTSQFRSRNVQLPAAKTKQVRTNGRLKQITLTHKEFIRDIYAPPEATNQIFQVNPGLRTVFPWLSNIANNFETYKFSKLCFEYIPNVGTGTDGAITISPDYDPADDNSDSSKSTLFSFEDTLRSPLWATATMVCSPKNLRKQTNYFVRNADLKSNLDIKMYDPLQLIVLVTGQKDLTVGELWVHYTITLETPQVETVEPEEFNIVGEYIDHTSDEDPFKNVTDVNGTMKEQQKATIENDRTIGIRAAGNYLIDLLGEQLLVDPEVPPTMKLLTLGTKFIDKHKLSDFSNYESLTEVLKYGQQWIAKANETSEGSPYPDGTNVNWGGLNTEGATFSSGSYNFLIRKITDQLYGKLAAAALQKKKLLFNFRRDGEKGKDKDKKVEKVKMSDESVRKLLEKHNMELI